MSRLQARLTRAEQRAGGVQVFIASSITIVGRDRIVTLANGDIEVAGPRDIVLLFSPADLAL